MHVLRWAVWLLLFWLGAASARADEDATPRPWLGVALDREAPSARVKEVLPESPCLAAGLHPGDEIISAGGVPVASADALIHAVQQRGKVGQPFTLRLRSPDGKERELAVTLTPRPNMRTLQRDVLLGKPAPELKPRVVAGPKLGALSALRGQVVLVDFFATWCVPCVVALPELKALHQRFAPRGLRLLSLSTEPADLIASFARTYQIPYTVAVDSDGRASSAYRVSALPTVVVVDRGGVVRLVTVGDLAAAAAAIDAALADRSDKPGATP